uniref:Movement protein n=1 Tax=Steinernema glaseri TaxID=37863 RepID=A0A1I7Z574_9BILA
MTDTVVIFFFCLLISHFRPVESNELIVETFENLDFGFNSHSIHQLIAAVVVFAVISALLALTVIAFRLYIYCREDSNTRQYQLPVYGTRDYDTSPEAHRHNKEPRNSFQAAFIHTVEQV